jgi:hypothetical protein
MSASSWSTAISIFFAFASIMLELKWIECSGFHQRSMSPPVVDHGWVGISSWTRELCDFLPFGVKYAEDLYASRPPESAPGVWKWVLVIAQEPVSTFI